MKSLYVIFFGVLGVLCRYLLGLAATTLVRHPFPLGTMLINILGAFLVGIVFVLGFERTLISPDLRVGLIVGFAGAFTTFSAYSLEIFRLLEEQKFFHAVSYFCLSPVLSVAAVYCGVLLARTWSSS